MKGFYSFSVCDLSDPRHNPKPHAQIYLKTKWNQRNTHFLTAFLRDPPQASASCLYMAYGKIYQQVKTHTVCAHVIWLAHSSSFYSCLLLGAVEAGVQHVSQTQFLKPVNKTSPCWALLLYLFDQNMSDLSQ